MYEIKSEVIEIPDVTCATCGGHLFEAGPATDGRYCCASVINGEKCKGDHYLCKKCNVVRDVSQFGKHGDVWECKECGSVCWAMTDAKRKLEAIYGRIASFDSAYRNIMKDFGK